MRNSAVAIVLEVSLERPCGQGLSEVACGKFRSTSESGEWCKGICRCQADEVESRDGAFEATRENRRIFNGSHFTTKFLVERLESDERDAKSGAGDHMVNDQGRFAAVRLPQQDMRCPFSMWTFWIADFRRIPAF